MCNGLLSFPKCWGQTTNEVGLLESELLEGRDHLPGHLVLLALDIQISTRFTEISTHNTRVLTSCYFIIEITSSVHPGIADPTLICHWMLSRYFIGQNKPLSLVP